MAFQNTDGSMLAIGVVGGLAIASLFSKRAGSAAYRNREIPRLWANGRSGQNGKGTFWTDGDNLYSYQLKIGWTDPDGRKILGEYTSAGDYYSQTTSMHVGAARLHADVIVDPTATHRTLTGQTHVPLVGR